MNAALTCFNKQCYRDLCINVRQPRLMINAMLFFIMVIVFFPLTLTPNNLILRQVIPGLIWMTVLLAMLLAADRLFQEDYDDGVIEQWLISGYSLRLIVTAKILIHWLLTLIPLLVLCPFLALLFNFSWYELGVLSLSLLAGTPAILFLCGLAAAFSTGIQQKGILMALILLPLTIPVMIFGSGALLAAMQGNTVSGYLAILSAFSLVAASFLPFAIAAIIRISLAD